MVAVFYRARHPTNEKTAEIASDVLTISAIYIICLIQSIEKPIPKGGNNTVLEAIHKYGLVIGGHHPSFSKYLAVAIEPLGQYYGAPSMLT